MLFLSKKKLRNKKGSVFAELTLVIPVLILFLFGMFELSRMFYLQNIVEYASKEAARIGSSIKESVDENFMSKQTISRGELERLITSSVRIMGVVEEPEQFMISYLNRGGNEVQGIQDLPFDRQNNPGSIEYVVVDITYPGTNPPVNAPIPLLFNPGNIFQSNITLMSRAVFKVEGRFER